MRSYLAIAIENNYETVLNSSLFTIDQEVLIEKIKEKTIFEHIIENETYVKTLVNNYLDKGVVSITEPDVIALYINMQKNSIYLENFKELEKVIILKENFLTI